MKFKITVIVPIYNAGQYLEKCIDSIINQTYTNLEIILVNDGSTDNSGAICDEYAKKDSRIKVIHKENGGLSSARNAGLDIASGEYVSFVDSDDWIEKDMLEVLYNACTSNDAELSCGGRYDVYPKSTIVGLCPKNDECISVIEMIKKLFLAVECDCSVCDKLFKRSLFDEIHFPLGQINEDEAIFYNLLDGATRVALVNKPLYNYFHRESSISTSDFTERKLVYLDNATKIKAFVQETYPELKHEAEVFYATKIFWFLTMIDESSKGARKKFKAIFKEKLKELSKIKHNLSRVNRIKYYLLKTRTYRPIKKMSDRLHKNHI